MSLAALIELAADVEGHLTLHANNTPTSTRYPQPDWSAQVIWIVTDEQTGQSTPASIYGAAATPDEASAIALTQIIPTQEEDTP